MFLWHSISDSEGRWVLPFFFIIGLQRVWWDFWGETFGEDWIRFQLTIAFVDSPPISTTTLLNRSRIHQFRFHFLSLSLSLSLFLSLSSFLSLLLYVFLLLYLSLCFYLFLSFLLSSCLSLSLFISFSFLLLSICPLVYSNLSRSSPPYCEVTRVDEELMIMKNFNNKMKAIRRVESWWQCNWMAYIVFLNIWPFATMDIFQI